MKTEQRPTKNPKEFNWEAVGLDFGNWEEEKLWALELPTTKMKITDLLWLFDAPFWVNDNGERYTITPWDVINEDKDASNEIEAMEKVDLSYPIDVFENHGKWLVLDGLHRLVKLYKNGETEIDVRIVPRDRLSDIASGYPIELPKW